MDKAFKIAVMLSAYDKMSTVINSAVDKSQRKIKGFQTKVSNFGNVAMIGGGAVTAFFAGTVNAARESSIAAAKMKNTFRSLGQENDKAAESALNFASKLQMKIGIEDEEINVTQAKIATFKSLSSETGRLSGMFDRATEAAFDMAALGFGDASSNAVQLGKALENPAKGIAALSKSGITFSDSEKKKIIMLQKSNHLLDAQKLIMTAIENQGIKGAAAAGADPMKKMKIAMGEVGEKIGNYLLPKVQQFATYLIDVLIPKIQAFVDKHGTLIQVIAAGGAAFLGLGAAAKVISFGMSGLSPVLKILSFSFKFLGNTIGFVGKLFMANPILLAVAAIAAIVYVIYRNWGGIKDWFFRMWEKVKNVFSSVWQWIKKMFLNYTPAGLIIKHWDSISAWFSKLWAGVKNIFSTIWEGIKKILWDYNPVVILYNQWDNIVAWFENIWKKVKDVFVNAWKSIKSFFGAGSDEAEVAMEKAKATLTRTVNVGINNQPGAVNNSASFGSPALQPIPVNNRSINTFAPVITYSGPGGPAAATQIGNDVVKQMKAYDEQQKRVKF